ncbi:Scr1 family TA system antitoxin-like transcriptional regulator [Kitasatospora sp. NPDC052896]|uniref:helix-turn-helix domain-containing protein n=1 Tax=Kitasatospora sp. NPDC052896 TaxID=3364061 RepID=UPI0037C6FBC0
MGQPSGHDPAALDSAQAADVRQDEVSERLNRPNVATAQFDVNAFGEQGDPSEAREGRQFGQLECVFELSDRGSGQGAQLACHALVFGLNSTFHWWSSPPCEHQYLGIVVSLSSGSTTERVQSPLLSGTVQLIWHQSRVGVDHLNRKKLDPQASPGAAFGSQLRSSREALGWSQDQLGERMGYSGAYVSAVERATKSPTLKFAKSADAAMRTGQTLELMWWGVKRSALPGFPEHAAQEARATEIRVFEPTIIPGLLQTPDYAAAHAAANVERGAITQAQADERLKFLAARQRLHERSTPPLVHAVLDESAIRRPIGGATILAAQLDHLVAMASRPHVVLQIAPFALAEPVPFSGFVTLLTFADRSVAGYTESAERGFVIRDATTVTAWERAYDRLQVEALPRAASLALIRDARKELT